MVLGLVISVTTALKNDVLILADPGATRIEGKILQRSADGGILLNEQRDRARLAPGDPRWAERRLAPSEVAIISPLGDRSVTGNYRLGSELWRSGRPLYAEGVHGFLYLPQAAMLFMPFEILPPLLGEVLWRWVGLFMYAWGVWALCRHLFPQALVRAFTLATALSIFAALGSLQNGQTNLVMGGLFALGVVDAANRRHWRSTLWFMLALACKPIALPIILLTAAVYPRLIVPLGVGLVLFVLAPFAHPSPTYVLEQYVAAVKKVRDAADPAGASHGQATALFSDIRGMLHDFGVPITDKALVPVRAAFALVFLGLCLWVRFRVVEPLRALHLLALGASYTMLFNPRTEGVTYAIIGPPAALLAVRAFFDRRTPATVLLVTYCLILQFSMQITNPLTGRQRKYWLRPLATIALVGYVIARTARARPEPRSGAESEKQPVQS